MNLRPRIAFMGAGSTIFLKNLIGDALLSDSLKESEIALYDIDEKRLEESKLVIEALNRTINQGKARVETFLGIEERRNALKGADFVVNAIQVGGYDPATIADFEIPKRYGLRQTIADTLGIGGIFRGLRTVPVMLDFVREMEEVCPDALLLNYTNPMAICTGAVQKSSSIQTVGLCHSVQVCAPDLLKDLGIAADDLRWRVAGINHMAWLLEIKDGKRDLYPEVKRRAAEKNRTALAGGEKHHDMVRYEMMRYFGYYITESSEHYSEYTPYWIRKDSGELVNQFNIPLDEYPRRCREQISDWNSRKEELLKDEHLEHEKTHEYGADIMNAVYGNRPIRVHGNVLNQGGLIENLPYDAVVELPCLIDSNGIQAVRQGRLPEQCAALNRTNINVQLLCIEAALHRSKDAVYQAALLDPHTAAELPPEKIISMCDELFEAHQQWLPEYR